MLTRPGLIQGFTDALTPYPFITNYGITVNYALSPTTFLEGTYGFIRNELAGGNENGILVNDSSNRLTSMPGFPLIYTTPAFSPRRATASRSWKRRQPPFWDGTSVNLPPVFNWGSRIGAAPPNQRYPGWLNINRTQDVAISMTKVAGRHTFKGGFYNNHSFKAQNTGVRSRERSTSTTTPTTSWTRASAMPTPPSASSRAISRLRSSSKAA